MRQPISHSKKRRNQTRRDIARGGGKAGIICLNLAVVLCPALVAEAGAFPALSASAPFISSADEVSRRIVLPGGDVEAAQILIDQARADDPSALLLLEPSGELRVGAEPLRLGSRMILRLSREAAVVAEPGCSASALIWIEDADSVAVVARGLEAGEIRGGDAEVIGIRVVRGKRVVFDHLLIQRCGVAGIDYEGANADVVSEAGAASNLRFAENGDGLRVAKSAGFVARENTFHDQSGVALEIDSRSGVVAENQFSRNGIAIRSGSDRGVITRNAFEGGTFLELTASSVGNLVSENHGTEGLMRLAGSGQQLFRNRFEGVTVECSGEGEMILVANEGLRVNESSGVRRFNPPTLARFHSDPVIVPGMGRHDMKWTGGNTKTAEGAVDLREVAAGLREARAERPRDVLVALLEGEFVDRSGKGLSLPPNTCLILKGRVLSDPGTPTQPPWKRGVPLTHVIALPSEGYAAISGGTLDAGRQTFFPVNADTGSIALIEGVNLIGGAREGVNTRGRDPKAPLFIYRCNVAGNRGRGIWAHAASRVHSIDNVCVANNTDGIDIDAHAVDSTALFNVCRGNRRHGVFVEEAVTNSVVYGNVLSGNLSAGAHVWNEEVAGNTGGNVIAANECVANRRGVSVGGRAAEISAHGNVFFANDVRENWKDGVWAGNSHATNNYFCANTFAANVESPVLAPEGAFFWNANARAIDPALETAREVVSAPKRKDTRAPAWILPAALAAAAFGMGRLTKSARR